MSDTVDRLLDGAVDLHVHPYPSPFPRRMDAAEAAQRAADAGQSNGLGRGGAPLRWIRYTRKPNCEVT